MGKSHGFKRNKIISEVTQIFRYKNLVLIYCVPAFNMIDTHLRQMMHMHIETIPNGIDRKKNLCFLKPRELYVDQIKGDFRRRKLRVTDPITGSAYTLGMVAVPLPPPEILQYYKALSKT